MDAVVRVNDASRKDIMTDEFADGGKAEIVVAGRGEEERVGGVGGCGAERAERALRVGLVCVAHGGVHT